MTDTLETLRAQALEPLTAEHRMLAAVAAHLELAATVEEEA